MRFTQYSETSLIRPRQIVFVPYIFPRGFIHQTSSGIGNHVFMVHFRYVCNYGQEDVWTCMFICVNAHAPGRAKTAINLADSRVSDDGLNCDPVRRQASEWKPIGNGAEKCARSPTSGFRGWAGGPARDEDQHNYD